MNCPTFLINAVSIAMLSTVSIAQEISGDPQSGDLNTRNKVVPISTTLHWSNARDLNVQLENNDDRTAFANLIIDNCNSNPNLSNEQRIDGYRIAANVLFMDGDQISSEQSFVKITQLSTNSHDLMNANRMLGMIQKSKHEYSSALNYYKEAWAHAQITDPDGEDMMSDSVLANICWLHYFLGMYEEGIDYALIGAMYFEGSESKLVDTAHYKYWQYKFNKELNDTELALNLLTELLDQHPKYGLLDDGSHRASLRMEKYKLQGYSWDTPSADFVAEAINIINDDDYMFSTYRIHIAIRLANMYELDYPNKAIEIRSAVYSKLLQDIDNSQISDYDRALVLSRASHLPYKNAITFYRRLHDADNALLQLDLLLDQSDVPEDIAGLAANFRASLLIESTP